MNNYCQPEPVEGLNLGLNLGLCPHRPKDSFTHMVCEDTNQGIELGFDKLNLTKV